MEFVVNTIEKGGVPIYPLAALSVWGLYIIIVKSIKLRHANIINSKIINEVENLLLARKIPEATAYCKQKSLPMTRIILTGIVKFEKGESELKEILEDAGRQEIPLIRSHLTALGTIASIALLLGLLGTVLGMISVFTTLSQDVTVNASMLAGGISEALLTSSFGMIIAVPTLTFYNFFITQVQNLIIEMERISLHMVAKIKRM